MHKPIWAAISSADVWLAYWTGTFETLLARQTEQIVLLSYEWCCAAASCGLEALAEVLAIEDSAPLLVQANRFRPPTGHDPEALVCDPARDERGLSVHDAMLRATIV